ncbi:MAG: hypothetical protein CL607_23050 [Anaerolineaceae bacterium]|nr:hypothetical protein [Anaerolineaceae bacterium]
MNTKVIALLKSRNPADRKQGVMLAGRSGETDYIRVLQKLASIEPDPYLKTLEEKTVEFLQQSSLKPKADVIKPLNKPLAPLAASQPTSIKRVTSKSVDFKKLQPRHHEPQSRRYTRGRLLMLALFTIVVIAVAALVLQDQILGSLPYMMYSMSNAKPFPPDSEAPSELTGVVYQREASSYLTYTIFEPRGPTPPDGWPLLLVNHGWGMDAATMAAPYYSWAQHAGVLLVATEFDNNQFASNNFYPAFRSVNDMMDEIEAYYPVDVYANIIMGFSWGGNMSYFYTHTYPRMFSGAVLASAPPYPLPPMNSEVKYAAFAGENESWQDTTLGQYLRELAGQLNRRGTPLWYWEVHNKGHSIPSQAIEKTKELMDELRAS